MKPSERELIYYPGSSNYWCCGECHPWYCLDCENWHCNWFEPTCRHSGRRNRGKPMPEEVQ